MNDNLKGRVRISRTLLDRAEYATFNMYHDDRFSIFIESKPPKDEWLVEIDGLISITVTGNFNTNQQLFDHIKNIVSSL